MDVAFFPKLPYIYDLCVGGVGVWVGMRSKHQKVSPEKRYDNVPRVFFFFLFFFLPAAPPKTLPIPKISAQTFHGRQDGVSALDCLRHKNTHKTQKQKKKTKPPRACYYNSLELRIPNEYLHMPPAQSIPAGPYLFGKKCLWSRCSQAS